MKQGNFVIRLRSSKRSSVRAKKAFAKLIQYLERPIAPVPERETECEARVRIAADFLERCRLIETAGLLFKTADGWDDIWRIRKMAESRLEDAQIALRFERGNF